MKSSKLNLLLVNYWPPLHTWSCTWHSTLDERPFNCSICGQAFRSWPKALDHNATINTVNFTVRWKGWSVTSVRRGLSWERDWPSTSSPATLRRSTCAKSVKVHLCINQASEVTRGHFFSVSSEKSAKLNFFFEVWKKNWLKIELKHWFLMLLHYHKKESTPKSKSLFLATFRFLFPPELFSTAYFNFEGKSNFLIYHNGMLRFQNCL